MASNPDPLSQMQQPLRVSYATGRMLGVEDFQAEQIYHRGRLARLLLQAVGTGTVSGGNVQTNGITDTAKLDQLELQVTPGMVVDRAGRIIDIPNMVCIRLKNYFDQQSDTNLSDAFKSDLGAVVADVFVSFMACDRGKTPSFATMDDYNATDAFVANRMLDSFGMQLVLRTDPNPQLPQDPWAGVGPLRAPGSNAPDPTADTLKQHILNADLGSAFNPVEYPSDPHFDRTSAFLARLKITATQSAPGIRPKYDLTKIDINNKSRLFLYPLALLARWTGLTTGEVK